ncbi:hypothetical protein, partial [Bifidobacterium aquikefiri]|uniref:hypothetical protein n=1 Tax=Bifidobacterium aquikefiri TaxID=1653207 RepID=UPI0023F1403F
MVRMVHRLCFCSQFSLEFARETTSKAQPTQHARVIGTEVWVYAFVGVLACNSFQSMSCSSPVIPSE